jgi:hypothetical protein
MVLKVFWQGGWNALTVAKDAQGRVIKQPLGSQGAYLKTGIVTA